VTRALLERIDRLNPTLNAFVTVTTELALEQARRAAGKFEAELDAAADRVLRTVLSRRRDD